jgi:transposase
MTANRVCVIGGVDTHGHSHHAAVIDSAGRVLGSAEFEASDRNPFIGPPLC